MGNIFDFVPELQLLSLSWVNSLEFVHVRGLRGDRQLALCMNEILINSLNDSYFWSQPVRVATFSHKDLIT